MSDNRRRRQNEAHREDDGIGRAELRRRAIRRVAGSGRGRVVVRLLAGHLCGHGTVLDHRGIARKTDRRHDHGAELQGEHQKRETAKHGSTVVGGAVRGNRTNRAVFPDA